MCKLCVVNVFVRWRFTYTTALYRAVRTTACVMPATTPSARSGPKSSSRIGAPTCCRRTRHSSAVGNSALNLTYVLSRCCLVLSRVQLLGSPKLGITASLIRSLPGQFFPRCRSWVGHLPRCQLVVCCGADVRLSYMY